MTIASGLGVLAGLLTRVMFYSEIFGGGRGNDQSGGQAALVEMIILLVSVVVTSSASSSPWRCRYRELAADVRGAADRPALPAGLGVGQDHRGDGIHPDQGPAGGRAVQRLLLRPGRWPTAPRKAAAGASASATCSRTHPTLERPSPSWRLSSTSSARPADGSPSTARRHRQMGLFDTILGRTKPVQANLDALFALPTAALNTAERRRPGHLGPRRASAGKSPPERGGPTARRRSPSWWARASATPWTPTTTAGCCSTIPTCETLVRPRSTWRTRRCRTTGGAHSCCARCSLSSAGPDRARRRQAVPARLPLPARRLLPLRSIDSQKERRDTELELRIRSMVGADLPFEPDLHVVPHVGRARHVT